MISHRKVNVDKNRVTGGGVETLIQLPDIFTYFTTLVLLTIHLVYNLVSTYYLIYQAYVQTKGMAMPDYSEDAGADAIVQLLKEYLSVLFLNMVLFLSTVGGGEVIIVLYTSSV